MMPNFSRLKSWDDAVRKARPSAQFGPASDTMRTELLFVVLFVVASMLATCEGSSQVSVLSVVRWFVDDSVARREPDVFDVCE